MKKIRIKIGIVACILAITACNDFLDKIPDNRAELNKISLLKELLVTAYPDRTYYPFAEIMSDNVDDKGSIAGAGGKDDILMYEWGEVMNDWQDTPSGYWASCYAAIATANQALESLERFDTKDTKARAVRGEALMCRAYAHYMLATFYCKPYNPATLTSDMGIPYVEKPENEVFRDYKRETLKETYEKIERDFTEGFPLLENSYSVPKYHFTREAAAAFGSRLYLNMGKWNKVIEYADIALGKTPVLRDWKNFYEKTNYDEFEARFTASEEPANLLLASTISSWGYNMAVSRFGLSSDFLKTLFSNPVSPLPTSGYVSTVYGNEKVYHIPKFKLFFKRSGGLNATTGLYHIMSVLFSTDEVLMNRAEAYTMEGRTDDALNELNFYGTSKSLAPANYVLTLADINKFYVDDKTVLEPFYSIPAESTNVIKCILDIKRTEFYHEGVRWFDILRMNLPVFHNRLSSSDNQSTKLELKAKDPRKQLQIPQDAQSFGIKANPR